MFTFRREERILLAQTRQNDFVFSSCPWHPSTLPLFTSVFLGIYRSDSSDFVQTLLRVHDLSYSKFSAAEFFSASYKRKKYSIFGFLRRQRSFLSPVVIIILEMLIFWTNWWNTIQLSGMHWYFLPKVVFRPVFVKKLEFFRSRFDIPHCPVRFLTLTLIFYKHFCRICSFIA